MLLSLLNVAHASLTNPLSAVKQLAHALVQGGPTPGFGGRCPAGLDPTLGQHT